MSRENRRAARDDAHGGGRDCSFHALFTTVAGAFYVSEEECERTSGDRLVNLAVEILVVVRVVDDNPHPRGGAVAGDALPEREGDTHVPVEKEKFLSSIVDQGFFADDGVSFLHKSNDIRPGDRDRRRALLTCCFFVSASIDAKA